MPEAPIRPTLLVIDPDAARRHALAVTLAGQGYEAVPALGAEEGLRFAAAVGPAVVVVPAALAAEGDGSLLAALRGGDAGARTLLLLGESAEEAEELSEEILFLSTAGLGLEELLARVRLVLVGREIGVAPNPELTALVGSFEQLSPLELVRALAQFEGPSRVELGDGELGMAGGRVVRAEVAGARGSKAFCRLARRRSGPYRVRLEPVEVAPGDPAGIDRELAPLVIEALEEMVPGAPADRLRVRRAGALPARPDDLARELLSLVDVAAAEGEAITVGGVLDRLPHRHDGEIHRSLLALAAERCLELAEPGGRVRVVTDSTADLPGEVARRHGIEVVPLRVRFGDQELRDGIEIDPRRFYELLAGRKGVHPTTSPPPVEDFLATYRALAGGSDLVSIHLSGGMSKTLAAAEEALAAGAAELAVARGDGSRPHLAACDSRSVSVGLGLQALFAARLAARGAGVGEIVERVGSMRERIHVLFVVDTLEYLARGGRIGRARALVGGLLGIKPILGVVDGEVAAVERVRGGRRAHPRMLELFEQRIDRARPVIAAVAHANAPMWADRLRALLESALDVRELLVAEIGPVVGTHAGPGTVGAALFQPADEAELARLAPLAS